ncbi:MAG: 50S ribosomal protein L15 [Thaumarchaeota archaeon]|nr:50S ribosomal protein L15 [Nitrososphaerota archaeon]
MASRLRKVRRLRGSRTHGWGQVAQHRRTGAKGGSGMAGLHKHKWSYTVKYDPDHFGSNKWHPPNQVTTARWINLYQLDNLAQLGEQIDLVSMGYDKLLGQGSVHKALKVKARRASSSAIEKIKAAGGSIEVLEVAEVKEKASPEKKGKEPTKKPVKK